MGIDSFLEAPAPTSRASFALGATASAPLFASQPAAQNRRILRINAVNLKNMLG
jgi:hypothetical protein